jgi:Carboxypeptidase regulatory-like domain/TonB-dependent Receptor Plug Domain
MFVRRFNVFGLAVMVCALLLATTPIFAQVTTGGIAGTVVSDADNSALPGVTVEAVHTPTGTRYSTVSGAGGRYTLPNVRVGGPYKVTGSLEGFKPANTTGVEVGLGATSEVALRMKLAAVTETVTVTARPDEIINPNRTGSTSTVAEKQIETLPTVNRSLQDFARTNPYFNVEVWDAASSRMTVAGRNNRYNTIQIDGAVNNDLFGLADTGTPGGQANTQPISLDAIQQIQLVVSPYDVRQGGFTGGGVNAVTRSGTNKIEGSAYGSNRNQNWIGVGPFNTKVASFKQTQYGARVGGPIMKDRLFFFVNGEENRRKEPKGQCAIPGACAITYLGVTSPSQTNPDPNIVRSTLMSKYGYDPGDLGDISGRTNNNLGFLRFDFNANNANQLTLRHNYVGGIFDTIDNRSASSSFRYPTSIYTITDHTRSTVGQLNSVFSASAFNEARVGYQTIKDFRATPVNFPSIEIGGTGPRTQTLIAGTERFSGANALDQKITELTDDFTWVRGSHTVTVGTHNEIFSFKNTFLSEFTGYYYYPTLDSFLNQDCTHLVGTQTCEYRLTYATGSDPKRPASFGVAQYGIYASDQWHVMPNLTFTFGLRGDKPSYKDTPTNNPIVAPLGLSTAVTPKDSVVWSPRVGFNWNPGGSTAQQVRGGVGVFLGRTPYVWISNAFANTGIESVALSCIATSNPATTCQGFPTIVADPNNQPKTFAAGSGAVSIDLMDPNFQFPRVLRGTLGYDRDLWFGVRGTIEGLYSKTQQDVFYYNMNRVQNGTSPLDGRPTYAKICAGASTPNCTANIADLPMLSNSSEGHEAIWSLQLSRPFAHGLTLSGGFAHQNTETSFDATSSRAISNWQFRPTPGDIFAHNTYRSQFEVKNRYNLAATYDFGTGPFTHSVGFFWNAQEGHPYSLLMGGDPNTDAFTSNDTLYIPANVTICSTGATAAACATNAAANPSTLTRWQNYLQSLGIDPSQSQATKANQFTEPWSRELDFHYELGLPAIRGIRASVQVDMLNLLNLMDREYGLARSVVNQTYTPVTYLGIVNGSPVYRENTANVSLNVNNQLSTANIRSRWQGKLGLRVTF